MSDDYFANAGPAKPHLLRGKGVNGEVLDLREEARIAFGLIPNRPSVATVLLLPMLDNDVGDLRAVVTPPSLYLWTGAIWVSISGGGGGAYAPSTPANWSPVPATLAAALDQLASRIATLESSGTQVDEFIAIAAQTIFLLSQTPSNSTDMELHVNGILYEQTDEYSVVGTTVTWNNSAFVMSGGEEVEIRYTF